MARIRLNAAAKAALEIFAKTLCVRQGNGWRRRKILTTPSATPYIYISEGAALRLLIESIGRADRVALDTEADSLHNYFEKVCLIQLTVNQEHFLIDPLAQLELSGFLDALADKRLVLHGGDYDLRMLRVSFGFRPRADVFDTMIAAQLLGIEQIGLAALIEKYFTLTIGKEGQKSDWSRRPLSEKQLDYAVNDTRFLEPLAERLAGELNERGRTEWQKESCRAMVDSTGRDRLRDPQDAWRIKGAGRLTQRQLAYLRELWHWRDQQARRANVPAFKVFGNQQILELLLWAETHAGVALAQGPKLPRNIRGPLLQKLEEAMARAAAMDPAQWPERIRGERQEALPAEGAAQMRALRDECARMATELAIAPATLAPRAALEAIVQNRARTVEEIVAAGRLLRWQAELLQGAVDKCLHSRH
jgi:ribonuclease D